MLSSALTIALLTATAAADGYTYEFLNEAGFINDHYSAENSGLTGQV